MNLSNEFLVSEFAFRMQLVPLHQGGLGDTADKADLEDAMATAHKQLRGVGLYKLNPSSSPIHSLRGAWFEPVK